ncbi:MAG: hypothetical protein LBV62_03620 [Rickettsiales bacterium]|jgi:hypothetical protein|nr:hypothetical protein [Rickettsiales bacterium]
MTLQSERKTSPATKINDVDPVDGKAKSTSLLNKLFKRHKKQEEQKTSECIGK